MARHSVAELWGAAQRPAAGHGSGGGSAGPLVRVPTGQLPAVVGPDALAAFVERLPISPGAMISGGAALAALAAVLAVVASTGFVGAVIIGGMFTFGGGIALLGMRRLRAPKLAPAVLVDPHVLAERTRRVHAVLAGGGVATFEGLLARLRWTERALVETLVAMKDSGAINEDLDLDTGEWVYRVQYGDTIGTPATMSLADRQQHSERA